MGLSEQGHLISGPGTSGLDNDSKVSSPAQRDRQRTLFLVFVEHFARNVLHVDHGHAELREHRGVQKVESTYLNQCVSLILRLVVDSPFFDLKLVQDLLKAMVLVLG